MRAYSTSMSIERREMVLKKAELEDVILSKKKMKKRKGAILVSFLRLV